MQVAIWLQMPTPPSVEMPAVHAEVGMVDARRIHIIGGPGSGKSTLARRLSVLLDSPSYDLDEIGYEDGAGRRRPLALKLHDLRKIAAQPVWITEGVFLWWTEELLLSADVIVWLDLPLRVTARRIPLRHLKAELVRKNRHPGWVNMLRLMKWTWEYHYSARTMAPDVPDEDISISRRATKEALRPYVAKVMRCRNARDVMRVAETIAAGHHTT